MWYNGDVADHTEAHLQRLQQLMTELLKRRIGESLERVEASLARWRGGECGEFEAHAEVLRHAARTEKLAARMARVGFDSAGSLMRDAFDAGLIECDEFRELMGCAPDDVGPSPPIDELADELVTLPEKRQVVDELLGTGAVLVHVDARREGVCVPERFRGDAKLVLRFGFNLSPAVPDLQVDDDGMCGTLTFGGVPHHCVLPWQAIYAVVSDSNSRGLVWPDDVPDDVIGELAGAAGAPGDEAAAMRPPPPARPKRPHLRLVQARPPPSRRSRAARAAERGAPRGPAPHLAALLADYPVARKSRLDRLPDERLGFPVGDGNGRGVRLRLDREPALEVAKRDRARPLREADRELQQVAMRFSRQRLLLPIPRPASP